MPELEDVFGEIRSLAHQPRTKATWEAVCRLLSFWEDETAPELEALQMYLRDMLPTWHVMDRCLPSFRISPLYWEHIGWLDTEDLRGFEDRAIPPVERIAASMEEGALLPELPLRHALLHGLRARGTTSRVPWMPTVEQLTLVGVPDVSLVDWSGSTTLRSLRLYGCTLQTPVALPRLERLELLAGVPGAAGMEPLAWSAYVPETCEITEVGDDIWTIVQVRDRTGNTTLHDADRFRGVFDGREVVLGRLRGNEIELRHPAVARRHSRLSRHDRELWILDGRTTNGTFGADGERIDAMRMNPGDDIFIADYCFRATMVPARPRKPAAQMWEPWLFE